MSASEIIEKLKQGESKLVVLGAGYMGLPTAVVFALKGIKVIAADINQSVVNAINRGECLIKEPGLKEALKKVVENGNLVATSDIERACKEGSVYIILVPTPLSKEGIDLSAVESASRSIMKGLEKGDVVILESTVPPGTTENVVKPILEEGGLIAGEDFYLAYCPERAMPGRTLYEIENNDRIISGINEKSAEIVKEIYKIVVKGNIWIASSPKIAEVVKIAENAYRFVNIAFANELALICQKIGADVKEVIELANKHPRVNIHNPGAGVGGHCLPKDSQILIEEAINCGLNPKLLNAAREINESMPEYVVSLAEDALKEANKNLENSKVVVLGLAYKGGTDDTRYSPAMRIVNLLRDKGVNVFAYDPFIHKKNVEDVLEGADCVIIATDHKEFVGIEEKIVEKMKNPGVVIDGRNILNPSKLYKKRIIYRGVGR